jgi:NTE family protein
MNEKHNTKRKVAIACQGGGSLTAFTAGALKKILSRHNSFYEIVALSGTSGGAICGLLAWYGLFQKNTAKSAKLLDEFWQAISAQSPIDRLINDWLVWGLQFQGFIAIPEVSPYYLPSWGQNKLRSILESLVDFQVFKLLNSQSSPSLLVGAVEALSGEFRVFKNNEIQADTILASAALPTLFKAVKIEDGVYWDSLFVRNPPVRDLCHTQIDEIWIIQINPQKRQNEPTQIHEIQDRRNELAGNISLNQEIHFIETINNFVKQKTLIDPKYRHIEIRRIEMNRALDYASKLNLSPSFIEELTNHGQRVAEDFLNDLVR